eukprot:TRINITY_DN430_c0_g2_i1.p1 TRINITY_DN430_c0_g2~~TRINITY_DN430_c0_g2_i1.p1  ORF type:complete len:669 (-),score=216.01 TRINITY_DN430_c0_g2_i1:26-2032(-)
MAHAEASPLPAGRRTGWRVPFSATAAAAAVVASAAIAVAAATKAAAAPTDCKVTIVGGGIGGAYTAWRLVVDAKVEAGRDVCLFEAKERFGGRILTVEGVPGFEDYAVDVGAYRYHRLHHPHMRSLIEGPLNVPVHCYTDPLNVHPDGVGCPGEPRYRVTARGSVYQSVNGSTIDEQLKAWSADIPYAIPRAYRWGPGQPLAARRKPDEFVVGPNSAVGPVAARWDELDAANYSTAMRIVDEVLAELAASTYKGTPWTQVSVLTLARAEGGMTQEELAYFFETDESVGDSLAYGPTPVAAVVKDLLRIVALRKAVVPGAPQGMMVPVQGPNNRRAGMNKVVLRLLDAARAAGVRIHTSHKAVGVERRGAAGGGRPTGRPLAIRFANGASVTTSRLFLNVPHLDVLAMGAGGSALPFTPAPAGAPFRAAVDARRSWGASKMYCYWDDAWWLTALAAPVGRVRTDLELYGSRLHDGHVTCDDPVAMTRCRGALLVSYVLGDDTSGVASGQWLATHDAEPYSPLTDADAGMRLVAGQLTPRQKLLWADVHRQLRALWDPLLKASPGNTNGTVPQAAACVAASWFHIGVHVPLPYAPAAGAADPVALFAKPVADLPIHLVNEAWGLRSGWAESSLNSAEVALFHHVGLPKPKWMDAQYHRSVIEEMDGGAPL